MLLIVSPGLSLLTILTMSIVGILIVMFLMLLINLCTFYRLEPAQRARDPFTRAHRERKKKAIQGTPLDPAIKKITSARAERPIPMVSVLIPARNEERCIEQCIRSLLAQQYEQLEVLVLDDQSSDATAVIVQNIRKELPVEQQTRLQLLRGEPLPEGWIGKNYACHQLALQARGEYLFFTDADTQHKPGAVSAIIAYMRQLDVALLTAQPEFMLGSPGERLTVPLLNFTILTLLPVALIPRRPEPSLATGNGQLLCFQRSAYQAIGGHEAVKGRILEDVLLARAIKAAGFRMVFVDGMELVRCRMYHSFREVWTGFSKNLFAFYNYIPFFALAALILNLSLFVLPLLLLLITPFFHLSTSIVYLVAAAYMLAVVMRVLLTLRFTYTQRSLMLLLCWLHPISILLECLILLNSLRWHYSRTGTTWKGRIYKVHPPG